MGVDSAVGYALDSYLEQPMSFKSVSLIVILVPCVGSRRASTQEGARNSESRTLE
jgi:hypothetical protein